jgi:hypothetical protein
MLVKTARLLAVVLAALSAALASEVRYTYRPVSVSFVPGFSTNGPEWRSVSSDLSLNIIGGNIGQVHGLELGGVFNIEEEEVLGYQAAGVFNVVGGRFFGAQQAGVFNIAGDQFAGAQMGGVFNVAGEEFGGAQMAGVINVVGVELWGAQVAGVGNVAGCGCVGTQVAGVVNVSGERMSGVQLSGVVNAADEFSGAQIGLVNITGSGRGLQLGLVNIADDVDVPIGLVSIVKHGMFHANVWATEFASVNVGIKAGSKTIYNVFMVGWQPDGESTRVFAGLGIGGRIPLNRFFADVDLLSHGVWTGPDWNREGGSDLLSSLRLTGGWRVTDRLAVTAGPTLNVWVSEHGDGSQVPFYDAPLYKRDGSEHVRMWPGFSVGLQLL